jgi:hypothetical protein
MAQEGVRTLPPKSFVFYFFIFYLFKDLFWDFGSMRKL